MGLSTWFTIFVLPWLLSATELKLSDSKLLLPFYSHASVNYTITGAGGSCFEWWSGTPEVVTVTPIGTVGQKCTNTASVASIWQSPLRATSTIYAREYVTGHVLKCDVIVDDIHNIKVDTTTQELYLHNTPESLVVVGYDEFGNTFSSLDGIPFDWGIYASSESPLSLSGNGVLRFLTWTESEYTTPSRIGALEAEGMQGYMQLVSGLRTGSAVVRASLREPVYNKVAPAKVRLLVMSNAQLTPPVLYLIPNSIVKFHVHVVRQDGDEEILMPSKQYYLVVSDSEIVKLDPSTGASITAQKYGQTTVTLLDRNVEEAIGILGPNLTDATDTETQLLAHHRRPMSIIYVVEPAYFRFSVQPASDGALLCSSIAHHSLGSGQKQYNKWSLEANKEYHLSLELFDQNNHRIFLTDNVRITITFPDNVVEVLGSSENGTIHTIKPLKKGPFTVKAAFTGVSSQSGELLPLSHPVAGSQDMMVYSPLTLLPENVNIAWDPLSNVSSGYQLEVEGGSGDYLWTVLNDSVPQMSPHEPNSHSIVTVSGSGVLDPKAIGTAFVVVSDLRNPAMCSRSGVRISQLSSLSIALGRVEVYLSKHPLHSNDVRLSSAVAARTIAMDTADLVPDPLHDYARPMSKAEKKSNAILAIGLSATDTDGNPIVDCHNLPIDVQPLTSDVVQVLPGLFYLPPSATADSRVCAYCRVVGLREGFVELEASYAIGDSNSDEQRVSTRVTVSVYKDIEFPTDESVIAMAVGSSRRISHTHGPQPWLQDPGFHFVQLLPMTSSEDTVKPSVRQRPQPVVLHENNTSVAGHTYIIRCESSGTFELSVMMGNRPSTSNPMPVVLSASVTLLCEVPSKVRLIPYLDLPTLPPGLPPCPYANRSFGSWEEVPISNNAPLRVDVVFNGPSGYELTGVDSIVALVHLSTDQGQIADLVAEREPNIQGSRAFSDSEHFSVSRPANPFFFVTPRSPGQSTGQLVVRLGARHRWPGEQASSLEATLVVNMASGVVIHPLDDFQLLLHPQATGAVHLAHGSGFFHFSVQSTVPRTDANNNQAGAAVACLTISNSDNGGEPGTMGHRDFLLTPRCRGQVLLRVIDLCFPASPTDSGAPVSRQRAVSIVGLGALALYAPAQMELQTKAPVYVRAIDTDGNILPAKFSNLLDLEVVSSSPSSSASSSSPGNHPVSITTAARCSDSRQASAEQYAGVSAFSDSGSARNSWLQRPASLGDQWGIAKLDLCGQALGLSNLKVVSGEVASNVAGVNVFAPMRLEPCSMNLPLGGAHQVTAFGGPSPRTLTFTVTPPEGTHTRSTPVVTALKTTGGVASGGGGSSSSGGQQSDDSVLIRSDASGRGHTGAVMLTGQASSPGGYLDLDTTDFTYWGLTVPAKSVSSATSCQVNVVALSSVRIGCPLPSSSDTGRHLITANNSSKSGGSGAVPVWVEGLAESGEVTPMMLADIQPPLHFSWRLSPPMPNGPAQLVHWLSQLQVDPTDTSLSSGMVLVGGSPGQVKLQLTVSTDANALTGQLVSLSPGNRPVTQLSAEMVFTVIPRLDLMIPPRSNPRIMLSPNSELLLKLPSYIVTDGGVGFSLECPSANLVQVSSSGLLKSIAKGSCDTWSSWRMSECRCSLRIDYRGGGASEATDSRHRSLQSLAMDVIVKPPAYLLARAEPSGHRTPAKPTSGLPFGGPFTTSLSFHDELGETFDAVSDELLSVRVKSHRSNLLDYSIGAAASSGNLGRLLLRLTPPLHATESLRLQTVTAITLAVTHGGAALAPTYLAIPTGHLFDVLGSSEFAVGQWTCLPTLAHGEGDWCSSDTSVLWIDNQSKLMLPLRPGHVHLQFTPKVTPSGGGGDDDVYTSPRASLMGMLNVVGVCNSAAAAAPSGSSGDLVRRRPEISGSSLMPVGLDSAAPQQVHLRFGLSSEETAKTPRGVCIAGVSLDRLSELSPFTCSIRLEQASSIAQLPIWLRAYLLAEHYTSTTPSILPPTDLLALPASATALVAATSSGDFEARLVPSGAETGAWDCVVKALPGVSYAKLAELAPGSRLVVEVKGGQTCGGGVDDGDAEVVSRSELTLVPAFRVIVPPMHLSGGDSRAYALTSPLLLTPRSFRATLVVFIPPATLAHMESTASVAAAASSGDGLPQLKARSHSPDILVVDGAPRPVYSAAPVKAALDRVGGGGGIGQFNSLLANLSRMMENEATISAEQAFGNGLIWTVGVKSLPTRTAIDTVVEVVLSLKATGQHVSVPLRVQTRSTTEDGGSYTDDDGASADSSLLGGTRGLWSGLSWLHLLLLVFLTSLLLLASHLVGRTLAGGGGEGPKGNLPPLQNTQSPSQSTPRLWSQGYGASPFASPGPMKGGTPPYGDTCTAFAGHTPGPGYLRSRYQGGSSPSRLREAFDNSL